MYFFTNFQEVVVLSDDEEDASELQLVTVKTEMSENSDNLSVIDQTSKPDLIDLTDEAFEDADVPRHYISWLTDLIKRAKVKPTTMDQRLEEASVSNDIIVIDPDPEENSEVIKKIADEPQTAKVTVEAYKFIIYSKIEKYLNLILITPQHQRDAGILINHNFFFQRPLNLV